MKERIIIIGGGFAGLSLVEQLDTKEKEVWVIDKVNHHMFQPLFYQVACGRIEPSNVSFPFRKLFQNRNIHYRMAEVQRILPQEQKIITENASFHYDKLVIATGCKTNFFGNEEMERHSFGMKTTQEAISIRNHILSNFEKLILEGEASAEGNWNIIIVGSGATGVELAGAFAEMKTDILPRDYPKMNFEKLRVILISATDKPLAAMSEEAQQKTAEYLTKMGVELFTDIVTSYDGKVVSLKSGQRIPSHNVIWAAGVTGNIIDGLAAEQVMRNRYIVDRYNRVKGFQNIFAIGDVAYMETPKFPNAHPQVANVAINQGKNLGKNLNKAEKNWRAFEYNDLGAMATIGKYRAVVDLPYMKFQGFFAWYVWMILHLMAILSVRNKIFIFFNWMWNYFGADSSLRLIILSNKKNKTIQ